MPSDALKGRGPAKESVVTSMRLALDILPQPDDVTCGPTCLQAVYGYYGDEVPIQRLIGEIAPLPTHGTLAVLLAQHALRRGYAATLYTYNLELFDPSWFREGVDLAERLTAQAEVKDGTRLRWTTPEYLRFLELGGELRYAELSPQLLHGILGSGRPILTGLSATYLYGCARELEEGGTLRYDDLLGEATGHFVVLYGYHEPMREVLVADPLRENPLMGDQHYSVGIHRLLGAIMMGVLTYDGNLLVIDPPAEAQAAS